MVVEAVRSVIDRSTYANLEFVVVADAETPVAVHDALVELAGERLHWVDWRAPFNFAAKVNRGALASSGDHVLLLNDDVEVISPDWLERMLGLAGQPGIGIVGAHLYFEDGSLQHGGHLYQDGAPGHAGFGWSTARERSVAELGFDRLASGVTAACALLSRDHFLEVGGMSDLLPGNYNDVDLCMKLRMSGLDAAIAPGARLFHYESKTRDATVVPSELDVLRGRWSAWLQSDRYWAW
jgi:GT2 family glycosyltransferase